MRILYHHRTLGDGAEGIHVASMVQAFRRLGHDVRVVSMIGEATNTPTMRTKRLERVVRYAPRIAYEALEIGYSAAGYRRLTAAMREWQPDLLYERYALFNVGGVAAAHHAGIPIVLEVNAPLAWERAHYERLKLRRLANRFERAVCSRADVIAVVSTPLKDYLASLGVAADRITVVPNGADPDVFRPDPVARTEVRRRLGIPDERVVIGFSGILRPWHGVDLLIEAAGRLAAGGRAHLLIVGDGPSRPDLESLAAASGLQGSMTITGRVPHADIPRYVAAFDIAVSPRTTFYASPMKVPEYMAAGIAVVAPRRPNLTDLVFDGEDGRLFTPEDVASLATTLDRLVEEPAERCRLGTAARRTIVNHRTWTHNASCVLGLIRELRACA